MSHRHIDEDDVLMVMDFGFGPEATLMSAPRPISLCGPCWEHDERMRAAVSTGRRAMDWSAPNLCQTHLTAFRSGGVWDRPLNKVPGRPVVQAAHCAVVGCEVRPIAKGFCRKHYQARLRRAQRAERSSVG